MQWLSRILEPHGLRVTGFHGIHGGDLEKTDVAICTVRASTPNRRAHATSCEHALCHVSPALAALPALPDFGCCALHRLLPCP